MHTPKPRKRPPTPRRNPPPDPGENMGATEPQPGLVEEKRHQEKLGTQKKSAGSSR
jgi:hypothetical protein